MASEASLIRRLQARLGPATFGLMAILLGLHVFFLIARRIDPAAEGLYNDHLALSLAALGRGELQTLLTYGFVHDLDSLLHLLFNVLVLYFFGPLLERRWGTQAFVRFFLIAVLAGGLLQAGSDLFASNPGITVGASAGLMALLAAFAWSHPDARVMLFFVVPVQARYLVPIVVGLDFLTWLADGDVAFFAHLGGLSAAWLMLRGVPRPRIVAAHARGWWNWAAKRMGIKKRKPPLQVIEGGRKGDKSTWN